MVTSFTIKWTSNALHCKTTIDCHSVPIFLILYICRSEGDPLFQTEYKSRNTMEVKINDSFIQECDKMLHEYTKGMHNIYLDML